MSKPRDASHCLTSQSNETFGCSLNTKYSPERLRHTRRRRFQKVLFSEIKLIRTNLPYLGFPHFHPCISGFFVISVFHNDTSPQDLKAQAPLTFINNSILNLFPLHHCNIEPHTNLQHWNKTMTNIHSCLSAATCGPRKERLSKLFSSNPMIRLITTQKSISLSLLYFICSFQFPIRFFCSIWIRNLSFVRHSGRIIMW